MLKRLFRKRVGSRTPPDRRYTLSLGGRPASGGELVTRCTPIRRAVQVVAGGVAQLRLDAPEADFESLTDGEAFETIYRGVADMLTCGYAVFRVRRDPDGITPVSLSVERGIGVEFDAAGRGSVSAPLRRSEYFVVPDLDYPETQRSRVDSVRELGAAWCAAVGYIEREFRLAKTFALMRSPVRTAPDDQLRYLEQIRSAFNSDHTAAVFLENSIELDMTRTYSTSALEEMPSVEMLVRGIASAFGVPPAAIGGVGDAKYANLSAQAVGFHRETLAPLAARIAATLTKALGARVRIELGDLLTGDVASQVRLAVESSGGPVLSQDEARAMFLGKGSLGASAVGGAMLVDTRDRRGEMRTDDGVIATMPAARPAVDL